MLGDRIKAYRKAMGLSQEELAERCGYKGKSNICKIEQGNLNPPQDKIIQLAEIFGVQVSELYSDPEAEAQMVVDFTSYNLNDDAMRRIQEYAKLLSLDEKYRRK